MTALTIASRLSRVFIPNYSWKRARRQIVCRAAFPLFPNPADDACAAGIAQRYPEWVIRIEQCYAIWTNNEADPRAWRRDNRPMRMKNRMTKIADYSCCAIARLMISMYKTSWGWYASFPGSKYIRCFVPMFNPFSKLMEFMLRDNLTRFFVNRCDFPKN